MRVKSEKIAVDERRRIVAGENKFDRVGRVERVMAVRGKGMEEEEGRGEGGVRVVRRRDAEREERGGELEERDRA